MKKHLVFLLDLRENISCFENTFVFLWKDHQSIGLGLKLASRAYGEKVAAAATQTLSRTNPPNTRQVKRTFLNPWISLIHGVP